MVFKEFIENIANLFEETDTSEFMSTTVFKELDEWSSLTALSVIAMVDEEYGITLKGDDIRNASTLEDLFNIVQDRV